MYPYIALKVKSIHVLSYNIIDHITLVRSVEYMYAKNEHWFNEFNEVHCMMMGSSNQYGA